MVHTHILGDNIQAGFYLGFIVLGEKSRVAEGNNLPRGVRGHAPAESV